MKNSTKILLKNFLQSSDLETNSTSSFLSEFKNLQVSTFSLKLYLSDRDSLGNCVDIKIFNSYFDKLKNTIISGFGGLCLEQIHGFYKNYQGVIMCEQVSVLMFHNFDSSLDFNKVKDTLKLYFEFGRISNQECLMLTLNHSTSLIFL